MTSSVAPTPVMPKTAAAVASPAAGSSKLRPRARSAAVSAPGRADEHHRRTDGQQREEAHLDDGEALDAVVAPAEEQRQREDQTDGHPRIHRNRRHDQMQHLRDAAEHAADLEQREHDHAGPRPYEPAHTEARPRHPVEGFEAGLAGRDRVPAQLSLNDRLDRAAREDQPERREAHLGAERGGRNQLTRSDDRRGEHNPGTNAVQRPPEAGGRIVHGLGR